MLIPNITSILSRVIGLERPEWFSVDENVEYLNCVLAPWPKERKIVFYETNGFVGVLTAPGNTSDPVGMNKVYAIIFGKDEGWAYIEVKILNKEVVSERVINPPVRTLAYCVTDILIKITPPQEGQRVYEINDPELLDILQRNKINVPIS